MFKKKKKQQQFIRINYKELTKLQAKLEIFLDNLDMDDHTVILDSVDIDFEIQLYGEMDDSITYKLGNIKDITGNTQSYLWLDSEEIMKLNLEEEL